MDNKLFREKSIEHVTSPEKLDAYLKITSPSVWFILMGVIVLLVGVICWASLGHIETTKNTTCKISNSNLTCYTDEETSNKIKTDSKIKLDNSDETYNIDLVNYEGQIKNEDANFAHQINMNVDDHLYSLQAKCNLSDTNLVKGKIIIEIISPIKYVFN